MTATIHKFPPTTCEEIQDTVESVLATHANCIREIYELEQLDQEILALINECRQQRARNRDEIDRLHRVAQVAEDLIASERETRRKS